MSICRAYISEALHMGIIVSNMILVTSILVIIDVFLTYNYDSVMAWALYNRDIDYDRQIPIHKL